MSKFSLHLEIEVTPLSGNLAPSKTFTDAQFAIDLHRLVDEALEDFDWDSDFEGYDVQPCVVSVREDGK